MATSRTADIAITGASQTKNEVQAVLDKATEMHAHCLSLTTVMGRDSPSPSELDIKRLEDQESLYTL